MYSTPLQPSAAIVIEKGFQNPYTCQRGLSTLFKTFSTLALAKCEKVSRTSRVSALLNLTIELCSGLSSRYREKLSVPELLREKCRCRFTRYH